MPFSPLGFVTIESPSVTQPDALLPLTFAEADKLVLIVARGSLVTIVQLMLSRGGLVRTDLRTWSFLDLCSLLRANRRQCVLAAITELGDVFFFLCS